VNGCSKRSDSRLAFTFKTAYKKYTVSDSLALLFARTFTKCPFKNHVLAFHTSAEIVNGVVNAFARFSRVRKYSEMFKTFKLLLLTRVTFFANSLPITLLEDAHAKGCVVDYSNFDLSR